jgi:hypothetical protein
VGSGFKDVSEEIEGENPGIIRGMNPFGGPEVPSLGCKKTIPPGMIVAPLPHFLAEKGGRKIFFFGAEGFFDKRAVI